MYIYEYINAHIYAYVFYYDKHFDCTKKDGHCYSYILAIRMIFLNLCLLVSSCFQNWNNLSPSNV